MNDLPRDDDNDEISPEEERARHRVRLPGFVSEDDVGLGDTVKRATSASKLSFPAGILNFESSCGVCDGWGLRDVGSGDRGWSGGDGCLLGELSDGCLVGAVCLAQPGAG
jgi:hypothetical protein